MTMSSFSFHCMICFEEFHPDDRYPVVLPCGHTYVCNVCADRLDKCMECRTPLFWNVPKPDNATPYQHPNHNAPRRPQVTARSSSWASARTRGNVNPPPHMQSNGRAQEPVKKRLPLPKNVVLLSLIEATELATEDAHKNDLSSPSRSCDGVPLSSDHLTSSPSTIHPLTDEEEEEKIKLGTSVAVSDAGTYAVAARDGLPIFPSRPGSMLKSLEDPQQDSEDIDAMVRDFHLENKSDIETTAESLKENRIKEEHPAHLSCGDRVQVVAIESGGWAKLARGYGYVQANGNLLVKVGSSVDRACRLEAMIRTISLQRKQLRMEQSKVDNLFIRLMNDLQISLMNDEDLTVIVADTFIHEKSELEERREESSAQHDRIISKRNPSCSSQSDFSSSSKKEAGKPSYTQKGFGNLSGSVDMESQGIPFASPYGPSAATPDMTTIFPSRSHPSPSAMRAGARAWRELHGRPASRGIDFKTGMSGHMALLSTHAHSHEYLDTSRYTGMVSFRKMSNHSGLTMTKSKQMMQGFFSALNIPILGTPPRSESSTRDKPGENESM